MDENLGLLQQLFPNYGVTYAYGPSGSTVIVGAGTQPQSGGVPSSRMRGASQQSNATLYLVLALAVFVLVVRK